MIRDLDQAVLVMYGAALVGLPALWFATNKLVWLWLWLPFALIF